MTSDHFHGRDSAGAVAGNGRVRMRNHVPTAQTHPNANDIIKTFPGAPLFAVVFISETLSETPNPVSITGEKNPEEKKKSPEAPSYWRARTPRPAAPIIRAWVPPSSTCSGP